MHITAIECGHDSSEKMSPRGLELDRLLELLEKEHMIMIGTLSSLREAIQRRDVQAARSIIQGMDETLVQHFLDEESTLLLLIVQAFGREGAAESIGIFQEHIEIDSLVGKLRETLMSGVDSSAIAWKELVEFMESHFDRENSTAFPCVREAARRLGLEGKQ